MAQQRFDNILKDITHDIRSYKVPNRKYELVNENNKDFVVKKEQEQLEILKSPTGTKISTVKKRNQKRSPYNLRSFKRKIEHFKSGPLIFETIDDKESNKIKTAESVIDSIINQLPDRKKLKFNLDSSNDIRLTEL